MNEAGYVDMPVQSEGIQHSGQPIANVPTMVQASLRQPLDPRLDNTLHHNMGVQGQGNIYSTAGSHMGQMGQIGQGYDAGYLRNDYASRHEYMDHGEHAGPLKKAIAHTDSLYKYLDWENPLRTVGSYVTAASLLLGLHYFPLTSLLLKAVATVLGVMSVAAFAGQSFNSNANTKTRHDRRNYTKVPEATLNATLRDVHDFVQYAVVEAQRILFGEDLSKTLAAFAGTTALYWFIKVLSPFGLTFLGLTSVYIGTLIASPRGRAATRAAGRRASDVTSAAAQRGKAFARSGKKQAVDMSNQAQETASDAQKNISDTVSSTTKNVSDTVSSSAKNVSDTVGSGTKSTTTNLAQKLGISGNDSQDAGLESTKRTSDSASTGISSGVSSHRTVDTEPRHTKGNKSGSRNTGTSKSVLSGDMTSNYTTSTMLGEGDKSFDTAGAASHGTQNVPRSTVAMDHAATSNFPGYGNVDPYIGSSTNATTATDNSLNQGTGSTNPFIHNAGLGATGGNAGDAMSDKKAGDARTAKLAKGVSVGKTDI
ncbi:hypothetical protein PFICI_13757 [Pestalotiopsis fici W106-1]|uniref:Reticulon domain-containing protein n=1 Tax=Pestalotiopsis fici (strain W106-1 / CGMCC3.15140) TaxID=1229662 RepID=W3WM55_PESFW|nr:uncharacterized protein PFICI_13757 [Pestalotiopsis fici W106-1]ETS73891.1 hypothetical protein PFICI_13757 [Pestalotiopsis fici W106-1]